MPQPSRYSTRRSSRGNPPIGNGVAPSAAERSRRFSRRLFPTCLHRRNESVDNGRKTIEPNCKRLRSVQKLTASAASRQPEPTTRCRSQTPGTLVRQRAVGLGFLAASRRLDCALYNQVRSFKTMGIIPTPRHLCRRNGFGQGENLPLCVVGCPFPLAYRSRRFVAIGGETLTAARELPL